MKEAYFRIFEGKDGTEFAEQLRKFRQTTEKQDMILNHMPRSGTNRNETLYPAAVSVA